MRSAKAGARGRTSAAAQALLRARWSSSSGRPSILAVDQDADALEELRTWADGHAPSVRTLRADFTRPSEVIELRDGTLDGILLANSLHFVRDAEIVLARLVRALRAPTGSTRGGRVVLVEYDRRDANPWVPYPISRDRLPTLAANAGLSLPVVTATRPSQYQRLIYAAVAERA